MKNILIDFTRLAEKCGFGEIADNYSQQLISIPDIQNMHFIFLVKEKHKGFAGERMYAHYEAFLFTSLLEGFGLPVLEAMRFACD